MNASVSTSATPLPVSEQDRLGSVALDQWRGLALVLVLISHGFFFTDRVNGIGRVGVNLFFFISGILVFRSLSRAKEANPWKKARSFWWRRFRRLYPAMITYTLAMLAVVWLLQLRSNPPEQADIKFYLKMMPWALGCVMNYNGEVPPSPLGHLWSIACEMQFYLIAPVIYLLGGATEKRKFAVFGFLLVVLMGLGLAQPFIGKWRFHFEFAVWPMMFGFCCEYKRNWFLKIPKSLVTLVLWFGIAICCASLFIMLFGIEMKPLVVVTGALLLAPCLMAYLFGRPAPGIAGGAMKWLGERTYSIYLWQQPFTICNFLTNLLHPFGALISVAAGGMWFRLFEWPFLTASRRATEKHGKPGVNFRRRKFFLLAAAILFAAIFLSVLILRAHYENRLRQQIWPAVAPEISVVSSAPANFHSTVLLLGDSRMAQWNLPQLSGWRVVNAGADGLTTGQIRVAAPKLLDKFHPDAVVLEAGINDLKFLGLCPELASELVSLVLSNMSATASECAARHCKIILLETWPAGKPGFARRLVWNKTIAVSLEELNARLQTLNSTEREIRVVDLFKEAELKPEVGLYRDTLHFKPEVYQRLTPSLEKELNTMLLPAR
jgi:peptidoglycan/LPS O-acetylase OafA/YrhL/lysophospholipase L1-like esterase